MAILVGVALGLLVWLFGRLVGLDLDRTCYRTILSVVALYYVLFAVMGCSVRALLLELIAVPAFFALTALGFRRSQWFVVAGLGGHGVYDCFHDLLITNPGMPVWWPPFCASIDITMAGFLAWIILSRVAREKGV